METEILKAYIEAKRREYYPKAKPWPNGLGFDHRRWEYTYVEARGKWQALYRPQGYGKGQHTKLGYGENPFDAYAHAKPVKEEETSAP